ncbi:MAG: hypothetical protein HY735_34930 [Verrucomicrobia bacterium]|nr:hypothetical protein [Verrucomicrobiota bacterium]
MLGKHQLKIYAPPTHLETGTTQISPFSVEYVNDAQEIGRMRRAHPYRPSGGTFIYPSIHYHLSRYKRSDPIQLSYAGTLPDGLNKLLGKGLPEGRCTAFIGERGGHKSHLGYLHLMHRVLDCEESGLVISLRDDENMTRETMARILGEQQFEKQVFTSKDQKAFEGLGGDNLERKRHRQNRLKEILDDWERQDKIEILYYHPGYITPEEFFHRMFMSIHRIKGRNQKLTVLFNSLDQLAARFPLCAKQEIFVPGMIEALCGEAITSIFIAVQEPGQPDKQYGLLPMADLVLNFTRERIAYDIYHESLEKAGLLRTSPQKVNQEIRRGDRNEVVVEVQRFAGGQRAGRRGILELVDDSSLSDYATTGLHFAELS